MSGVEVRRDKNGGIIGVYPADPIPQPQDDGNSNVSIKQTTSASNSPLSQLQDERIAEAPCLTDAQWDVLKQAGNASEHTVLFEGDWGNWNWLWAKLYDVRKLQIGDVNAVQVPREVWPSHKCSMTIIHNQHLDYYQTIEDYLSEARFNDEDADTKDACIAANEVWEIQWYPETPIGFYVVVAPTLEKALAAARHVGGA